MSYWEVVVYNNCMSKDIKFTSLYDNVMEMFYPKPASEYIPDWYKNQPSYTNNKRNINDSGKTNATIKKCIPVFDAITAGYIIVTCMDIEIIKKEKFSDYKWAYKFNSPFGKVDPVVFHNPEQADKHPSFKDFSSPPKFINPWSIQTPKGYSTLFVAPMHRDSPFEILPGIVDTDMHFSEVNFPFSLKDPNWSGIIPAGTPIAQVIPFKRDSWKKDIGGKKEQERIVRSNQTILLFFSNAYKKLFWSKKIFK